MAGIGAGAGASSGGTSAGASTGDIISGGLQVVGTIAGLGASKRSIKHQKEALGLERRKSELSNIRSVKQGIRQAAIAAAESTAEAQFTGTSGSSTAQTVQSSIKSQLGSEIGFIRQQGALDAQISGANQSALNAQASKAKIDAVMGVLGGMGGIAQVGQALGLSGAPLASLGSAMASGGNAVMALAAANPIIAAALIAAAILGEDEIKRIGRDLDKTVGIKGMKDRTESTVKEVKRIGSDIADFFGF